MRVETVVVNGVTCYLPTEDGFADGNPVRWLASEPEDARAHEKRFDAASPLFKLMILNAYTADGLSTQQMAEAMRLGAVSPESSEKCWLCPENSGSKAIADTGLCRSHILYALATRK